MNNKQFAASVQINLNFFGEIDIIVDYVDYYFVESNNIFIKVAAKNTI